MSTKTQNNQILQLLKAGSPITPQSALALFGCMRLAARIHDLKARGHVIEKEMVSRKGKRFAVYWMPKR